MYLLKLIVWKVQRFLTHAAIQAMLWSRYIWKEIIEEKNEDTILNYIGEGIQQFQDDVNWTSDKIQEILMLAKLFRPTYFIFKLQSQTEKLLIVVHVMVLMKEHRSLDSARENFWVDYSNNYSKFILLKAICIIPQE